MGFSAAEYCGAKLGRLSNNKNRGVDILNKVFLSGNLTRDVEVRYSQQGTAFARTSIAINRHTNKEKAVDFFNVVSFGKTAEFCGKYFHKGSRVLVEGRLQTNSYEKDGVKHNATDVIVDNIEFAGDAKKKDDLDGVPVDDDDTPF